MLNLINYIIKGLIIILGLAFLLGFISLNVDRNVDIAFGILIILFGIYRIVIYRMKKKTYEFDTNGNSDE